VTTDSIYETQLMMLGIIWSSREGRCGSSSMTIEILNDSNYNHKILTMSHAFITVMYQHVDLLFYTTVIYSEIVIIYIIMDIRNFFQKNASNTSTKSKDKLLEKDAPESKISSNQLSSVPADASKRIKLDTCVASSAIVSSSSRANDELESSPEALTSSRTSISKKQVSGSPARKITSSRRGVDIVIEESDHDNEDEVEWDNSHLQDDSSKNNSKKFDSKSGSSSRKKETESKKIVSGPPIKPNKSIPVYSTEQATPGVLNGLNFVLTGVLTSIGREDAEDYIKILGGKVTTAVSGKTHYLVCGTILEDGRAVHEGSKYKKAKELGDEKVAILHGGEGELYALVELLDQKLKGITINNADMRKSPTASTATISSTQTLVESPSSSEFPSSNTQEVSVFPATATTIQAIPTAIQNNNPYAKNKVFPTNPYAKKNPSNNTNGLPSDNTIATAPTMSVTTNPYAKKPPPSMAVNPYSSTMTFSSSSTVVTKDIDTAGSHDPHTLWTDKYAPTTSENILGNKDCITKLGACKF